MRASPLLHGYPARSSSKLHVKPYAIPSHREVNEQNGLGNGEAGCHDAGRVPEAAENGVRDEPKGNNHHKIGQEFQDGQGACSRFAQPDMLNKNMKRYMSMAEAPDRKIMWSDRQSRKPKVASGTV